MITPLRQPNVSVGELVEQLRREGGPKVLGVGVAPGIEFVLHHLRRRGLALLRRGAPGDLLLD